MARLKGSNIGENTLTIHGKGGRVRRVPIAPELRAQLNPSAQSVFGVRVIPPWVNAWYREVRRADEELGIQVYGIHRFRANYAQEQHQGFLDVGLSDKEARLQVAELLEHDRVDVTYSYIGKE